ncbi:MAG: hypothetical protein SXQ77_12695 [Halobacteria archaeon]|nr:hypothetical protein [Halobacteria archaeon]
MGLAEKAFAAVFIIIVVGIILTTVAVATGYVLVGNPSKATTQVINGEIKPPDAGVVEERVILSEVSSSSTTVDVVFYVNNTHNQLGGSVDVIDYELLWAERREGNYRHLANGTVEDLTLPPTARITEKTRVSMKHEDVPEAGRATATYMSQGEIYLRMKGNISVNFGPIGYSVPFDQTKKVETRTTVIG